MNTYIFVFVNIVKNPLQYTIPNVDREPFPKYLYHINYSVIVNFIFISTRDGVH
jgi:hypothetical protein